MVLKIECFADDPTGCVGRPSCKQDLVDLFYAPMWIFLLEIREKNLMFGMRSHARRMKLKHIQFRSHFQWNLFNDMRKFFGHFVTVGHSGGNSWSC
jgi:hypothetical protein